MILLKTIGIIIVLASPVMAGGFCDYDPWYAEVDHFGIVMPDKVAHFYRSYYSCKTASWLVVAALCISYEVYDSTRGVGFSWKDQLADFAGIIAAEWFSGGSPSLYVEWNNRQYQLIIVFRF